MSRLNNLTFTKGLKEMSSLKEDTRCTKYILMKYPHPDSGQKPTEYDGKLYTLKKAQAFCQSPESSFKEGNTKDWWFIGYVSAGDRTRHITLW